MVTSVVLWSGPARTFAVAGAGFWIARPRREREDNAAVIILTGDDSRLAGFDKFLEAAADKQALPLEHGFFGIEVAAGERLE
ncbi:hypothetical protein [Streptomyces sp. NPDC005141]